MIDEEDPIAGAVREIQEELGMVVKPVDFELVGELHPRDDRQVFVVRYRQPVEWQDITIQEGARGGLFHINTNCCGLILQTPQEYWQRNIGK